MESLSRFDVAAFGDVLMVVVESQLLPPDPAIVVIPLLQDYPVVTKLNPMIHVGDKSYALATRLIAPVLRAQLRYVGTAADQGDEITRAIDVLMGGI